MKSILYRLLLGLALASGASACSKEVEEPELEFFVRANKDGKAWLVPGEATYVSKQAEFYVFGRQDNENATQAFLRLGFGVPMNKPLTSAAQTPAMLVTIPATWTVAVGGDVLTNSYTQDSLPGTHLLITRLDTVRKIVEGSFDATLRRDARWSGQEETIHFTEGSFRIRYQQY